MNLNKLEEILRSEKPFRLKQVKQAIFRDLIENWDEATTLPLTLREQLKKEVPLSIEAELSNSADGKTSKALIRLVDGEELEAVLMRHGYDAAGSSFSATHSIPVSAGAETPTFTWSQPRQSGGAGFRNTICVSSQVGCPLGCVFCATGQMGFIRNLTAGEIVNQVLFWARYLKKKSERVNNVVFMGMGEPFLNYDNVLEAIKILNDDNLLGIGARHISISTVGVIEGIERMAEDMPQINLAISLHAPNDELRQKLMPINKKYPLAAVIKAAKDYVAKTNRKLMFEYIMIKGINDSEEQARQLVNLMDDRLFFINLIAYNPTGIFEPSLPMQIKKFKDVLEKSGIQALQRYRFGQDVKGACGQLASSKKAEKTINGDN